MNNRNYFLLTFGLLALTFGLMFAVDPQAVTGLVIGFGKALLSVVLVLLFVGFLIVIAFFAPKVK